MCSNLGDLSRNGVQTIRLTAHRPARRAVFLLIPPDGAQSDKDCLTRICSAGVIAPNPPRSYDVSLTPLGQTANRYANLRQ